MSIDIGGMRKPYKNVSEVFTEDQLVSKEPFGQFEAWFNEAKQIGKIEEPNAMCLATSSKDGMPSCRMVLLKRFGKEGFVFFTNYDSRKGKELEENPKASLCFYWDALKKSVRIEGSVEKVSEVESLEYFQSRPKASQIGACISQQSKAIVDRSVLTDAQVKLEELFKENSSAVPKPNLWGGYRVIPDRIEFWKGQSNRVHDRILFRRKCQDEQVDWSVTREGDDDWLIQRLAP